MIITMMMMMMMMMITGLLLHTLLFTAPSAQLHVTSHPLKVIDDAVLMPRIFLLIIFVHHKRKE